MPYTFTEYTARTLKECGTVFCDDLAAHADVLRRLGNRQFTDLVLDWFAATAAEGCTVDAHAQYAKPWQRGSAGEALPVDQRGTTGEFLVDLCHTTYPDYDDERAPWFSLQYWQEALTDKNECKVRLALECEWGKWRAPTESTRRVLEDASKLAAIRADVKVIVFSSHERGLSRTDTVTWVTLLRRRAGDRSPWLWIDVPWAYGTDCAPAAGVLED